MARNSRNGDEVLFVRDVAAALGISEKAVRRRVEDERRSIPWPRYGPIGGTRHRIYWFRRDFEEWRRGGRRPRR